MTALGSRNGATSPARPDVPGPMDSVVSPYPALGPAVVPDGCRVVRSEMRGRPKMEVFAPGKDGEYLLMDEHDPFGRGPSRRWYDPKGRLHRDEGDGPAHVEPKIGLWSYHKHGKMHRLVGPAFHTATGRDLYYLEGKELSKAVFDAYVASGKAPKLPKVPTPHLKAEAARLGADAVKKCEGQTPASFLLENIQSAASASNWKLHGPANLQPDGSAEYCLNCAPLDDQLRCYVVVSPEPRIVSSYLAFE